ASALVEGLERRADGVVVLPLAEARESHAELIERHLGKIVPAVDAFTVRNEESWRDGLLVYVTAKVTLELLVQLAIVRERDRELHWRALIVLDEGAEAEIWERYHGGGAGLFNGVVELAVGDGANLRYVCEQELDEEAWVFATQRAEVGRDASLEWVALGF